MTSPISNLAQPVFFMIMTKDLSHRLRLRLIFTVSMLTTPLMGIASGQDQFSNLPNTEKQVAGFLKPDQSLQALKLPTGFKATLFAAEPDIRQPIAAATDQRGRLWVCENYTYSESKVNFNLKLNDRIVILNDQDGDGRHDERKVFWDQGKRLTSIAIGFDGIYVACAPELLFIPDRNHDDRPDGPPEVLLDGWNDNAVRHNIVNGLKWGPDGWLYGRHGIMATSFVGVPGATRSQRTAINCGVWRYHPLHRKFEVVAHGTTNPWGMDYNNDGDLFMINTVIGHLWHVVPGARYKRMYGAHFNPYTYQNIQQTADHVHWNREGGEAWHDTKKIGVTKETDRFGGGHAHCGLLFYGDDDWPPTYRNTVLTCNLLGHRINNDRLVPKGNGFVGQHNPDFAKTSDTWFRGIELVRSHDQGFYLLDWQDTGECHENDGVHRTSGRIYKITYGQSQSKCADLRQLSEPDLLKRLTRDRWHFEHAAIELRTRMQRAKADKKHWQKLIPPGSHPSLAMFRIMLASDLGAQQVYGQDAFNQPPHQTSKQQPANQNERDQIKSHETRIRELVTSWGNEMTLGRPIELSPNYFERLASTASPRIRLLIASQLFHLNADARFRAASALLRWEEDQADNIQPLLIWYAVEPLVATHPQKSMELALRSKVPLVSELLARRMTERIDEERFADLLIEMIRSSSAEKRPHIVAGIEAALNGRRKVAKPKGWDQALAKLKPTQAEQALLQKIAVVFGDGRSLSELRKVAENKNADARARGQAFLTLAENKVDGLLNLLNKHFGDKEVRRYVIEAYANCEHTMVAHKIIGQFQGLKPASQQAAVNTLTKRANWAKLLLQAIQDNRIDKSQITAWHARQIANLGDAELIAQLESAWGSIKKSPAKQLAEMERLKALLEKPQTQPASPKNGQALFSKSCANCHVLFGQGGKIGPDLTGGNRRDLGYLLENLIDPDSSVAESYRSSIVSLVDGRTLTGVITQRTAKVIQLQTAEKLVVVDVDDVERVKQTQKSLMPEGLLEGLSDQQIRDLIAYLQSN